MKLKPRERLLNSAAKLFYKEGVHAVGIERVLEDADTAKASLYSNFGSKDALVTAYLEREGLATAQKIESRLAATPGSPRDKILKLFDMLSERCGEKNFRGCPFQNAAAEITDPKHPGRAVIEKQQEWMTELLRGLVVAAGFEAQPLTGALVALHGGAIAGAMVDPSGAGAKAARWAAERLLEDAARASHSKG
ncbi:MAG: TetR/AcrR family transcriptional regulator [Vicinamibacteria bacterium]|nr:TetR/AcrR family transcriptional regulator [Vicinamibacteria bacterium]